MDMLGKVRRMKLRDGLTHSEIARRTGLSRNTVKKWLKAAGDEIPQYRRKEVVGKLTAFVATLEQALRVPKIKKSLADIGNAPCGNEGMSGSTRRFVKKNKLN